MLSGSMVDRPTFSIIDKETGEYLIKPGEYASTPNRFYLSPCSALRDFYVNLDSALDKIVHDYELHGYLSDKRKELFKKISRPIAVKNDITQEITEDDSVSKRVRMTFKGWLIGLSIHPLVVEDYFDDKPLDVAYVTVMVNQKLGEVPPRQVVEFDHIDLWNIKLSKILGTRDRAIIFSKFKDEDDLVMWKLNQTISVDDIRIEDLDKSIEKIKTVEAGFGISFKES